MHEFYRSSRHPFPYESRKLVNTIFTNDQQPSIQPSVLTCPCCFTPDILRDVKPEIWVSPMRGSVNPRHKTFCRSVSPTTSDNTVLTWHSRYEIRLGSGNPSVAKLTDNYIWRKAVRLLGMGSRGTPHLHGGGVGGKNLANTPCVLSTTGLREWLMS